MEQGQEYNCPNDDCDALCVHDLEIDDCFVHSFSSWSVLMLTGEVDCEVCRNSHTITYYLQLTTTEVESD